MTETNQENPSLAEFRTSTKKWLKDNDLNTSWLATNLNKAEGTVKNWLYNPSINITRANQEEIRRIQQQHESGGSGLRYANDQEVNMLAGYAFESQAYTDEIISQSSLDPWQCLDDWLLSAGTPIDATAGEYEGDNLLNSEQLRELATWVTDQVMSATKQTIRAEKERLLAEGKQINVRDYQKDGGGKMRANHFNNSYNASYYIKSGDEIVLPVLRYQWNAYYLEIAAAISGIATIEFVAQALNKAVDSMSNENLDAFLDGDVSTSVTSYRSGYGQHALAKEEQDLPF